jgi:hypothetical protein
MTMTREVTWWLVAASMLLASCSTTPTNEPVAAPAERVASLPDPGSASGTITFVRDSGFTGRACNVGVFVNQALVARLAAAETATFKVPSGEVLLKVGRDPAGRGLCAVNGEEWTQRETSLKAGEHKTFRVTIDGSMRADVQRADTR